MFSRYNRMLGKNVLYCLGYDAFGLPAEQYAVQTGQHPRKTTEDNIVVMARQLRRLGMSHDDRRSIQTIDPDYYKWTQWIFLQIFNSWYDTEAVRPDGGRGRARPIGELVDEFSAGHREVPGGARWADLSDHQQADLLDDYRLAYHLARAGQLGARAGHGARQRGGHQRGPLRARELPGLQEGPAPVDDAHHRVCRPAGRRPRPRGLAEKVKIMQRNWIGRSNGARSASRSRRMGRATPRTIPPSRSSPRARTPSSVPPSWCSPGAPLLDSLVPAGDWPEGTKPAWTGGAATPAEAVAAYRLMASRRTDLERQADTKEKTGVFTGGWAVNPVNGTKVPVFVADYVLMGYGTGAIMAVPAQDERDWDFATRFDLPIVRTVEPPADHDPDTAFTGDGPAINSQNATLDLDGLGVADAKAAMITWLEEHHWGEGTISYKLRDWLFSRQRYWGEPFPIVFDAQGVAHALPESMLPLELPDVPDYSPKTFDPEDNSSEPKHRWRAH